MINYTDIKVELLTCTEQAGIILHTAMNMTMKQDYSQHGTDLDGRIKRLIEMGHTSLFEHVNYTFLIEGASRNFLAQMTRHRMASYTSGSQHYQDYRNYQIVASDAVNDDYLAMTHVEDLIRDYGRLIDAGVPKEEARQILPGGMQNNLMVTINARSLMNFFNLRLCRRNVQEMKVVATQMYRLCYEQHPYIWANVGPDCLTGKCRQGKMACKEGKMSIDELLEDR